MFVRAKNHNKRRLPKRVSCGVGGYSRGDTVWMMERVFGKKEANSRSTVIMLCTLTSSASVFFAYNTQSAIYCIIYL